jgi:hypothetical protein
MQEEIDQEKEDGLGLPVSVTNDVAQQQMMAQVPSQPMNPADQEHQLELQNQQNQQQKKQASENTLVKLKQIL